MASEVIAKRISAGASVLMYQHDEQRFQIVCYWKRPDVSRSPRTRISRSFIDKPEAAARLAFARKCARFGLRSPL
jgi:hypothetical protein